MIVKLLTEHHLEFLSLTGGCTGSSESTLVKMPHCWESHVTSESVPCGNCFTRFQLINFIKANSINPLRNRFNKGPSPVIPCTVRNDKV